MKMKYQVHTKGDDIVRTPLQSLSTETHTQDMGQDNNSPAENIMYIIRRVEH